MRSVALSIAVHLGLLLVFALRNPGSGLHDAAGEAAPVASAAPEMMIVDVLDGAGGGGGGGGGRTITYGCGTVATEVAPDVVRMARAAAAGAKNAEAAARIDKDAW